MGGNDNLLSYDANEKYKIYSAIMSVCILLTSCSSGGGGSYETDSKAFSDATVSPVSSVTATTAPVTTVQVTTAPVTTVPETTKVTTTAKPEAAVPSASATATAATEKPKWSENKADETLYVTVDCYERTGAYIGAPAGSILKRGSKIAVTAMTDTDYYKLKTADISTRIIRARQSLQRPVSLLQTYLPPALLKKK